MFEKLFQLKKNGTTVGIEVVAGLSTFMTMAYIIALNPSLLTNWDVGSPLWNGVFLATVISAAIGTLLMAFLANKPFALAPGMGLNSYFAQVVATIAASAGVSYQEGFAAGLTIILISGILFTLLTLFKIRTKIVDAIPLAVRAGIPAGIGLMLVYIGFTSNAGLFSVERDGLYYMLTGFFSEGAAGAKAAMGDQYGMMVLYVLTAFLGLFLMAVLSQKKVKGAVLIGMLASSVVFFTGEALMGVNPFASLKGASFVPPFQDMVATTLFKFDFQGLLSIGLFAAVMTIITFCMVDMFDTIGTLYGTAKRANMINEKTGQMDNMSEALLSDSLATCVGACTGTSTVTTYIESAAGVEAGGRTGLASVVTGLLFLLSMFIAPIAALIPAPATSAALIFVGILMMGSLKEVDYSDYAQVVPVVLMLIFMMGTSGIGNGIGIGLISYSVIKICTGKIKEVSILTMILSLLFIGKFFVIF